MGTLTSAEIGSIVYNLVDGITVGISGVLTTVVDQQRYFAEQFTGDTIGTDIAERYQPGIIDLTIANVLGLLESQGLGTKSVKIGELSITKGMYESASMSYRTSGMNKLKAVGERMSFYRTF